MEEIKVGEYARTTDGIIGKIENYDNGEYWIKHSDIDVWKCADDVIVKHSKILSEVVEVGDYVNGYKVISIDKNAPNDCKEGIELDRNNAYEYQWISKNEIETILTKEQYMQNCYTVERKE